MILQGFQTSIAKKPYFCDFQGGGTPVTPGSAHELHNVFSSSAMMLTRRRLNVLLLLCVCQCSVSFPRGDLGWIMVCDFGIF